MDDSTWNFVYDCGCDIEFVSQQAKELDKIIENKADEIAQKKVEQLFLDKKEEFQLEVLKQFQEDGIKNEGMKLSSASPLISDTYIVDSRSISIIILMQQYSLCTTESRLLVI